MRFLCTNVFTLTWDLVMSDKSRGATPRRLGKENFADQELEDIVVQTLNFADLSNFADIIELMESSIQNAIITTNPLSFGVFWTIDIGTDQLTGSRIGRKFTPKCLGNTFIQTAKKFAGFLRSKKGVNA